MNLLHLLRTVTENMQGGVETGQEVETLLGREDVRRFFVCFEAV